MTLTKLCLTIGTLFTLLNVAMAAWFGVPQVGFAVVVIGDAILAGVWGGVKIQVVRR
jgi:hypothetical protein